MEGFASVNVCTGPLRAAVLLMLDLLRTRNATQRMICVVVVAFAATINPAVVSGAVTGSCSESDCHHFLEGRIEFGDVATFKQSLEKVGGKGRLMLFLNSEGGDIAAAIEIGRLVRRWPDSVVVVSLNSKCFSACVFVLAGGLHRTVHGTVGIHRPFGSATEAQSFDATQKKFRALEQAARNIFKT